MSITRLFARRRLRSPRRAAFTLLEVVIAMTVFSVISGAVFGVVQASMQSAAELESTQRENRRTTALFELCRRTFATLPPKATFRAKWLEDADPAVQEIEFRNAPLIFSWGGTTLNYGSTTLGIRPQEDGKFSVAISRSDFVPPEEPGIGAEIPSDSSNAALEPDEQGRYWLVLMPDLEWAQWRFYDPRISDWADMWQQGVRTRLIELEFLLPGDTVPMRAVFPVAAAQPVNLG